MVVSVYHGPPIVAEVRSRKCPSPHRDNITHKSAYLRFGWQRAFRVAQVDFLDRKRAPAAPDEPVEKEHWRPNYRRRYGLYLESAEPRLYANSLYSSLPTQIQGCGPDRTQNRSSL